LAISGKQSTASRHNFSKIRNNLTIYTKGPAGSLTHFGVDNANFLHRMGQKVCVHDVQLLFSLGLGRLRFSARFIENHIIMDLMPMGRWIDISMAVTDQLRTNHSRPGEEVRLTMDVAPDDTPQRKTVRRINTRLHIGTHIDGPEHLVFGAPRLDEIPIERFTGRAWIGDMYHKVPRGIISASDMENVFGDRAGPGDILILRTGWNSHYAEPDFFVDTPIFGPDAPEWCIARKLNMVVVDFLCDPIQPERQVGGLDAFKTRLLAKDILIMTNADHLDRIKSDRVTLYAFPIKIVPSEAAPTRAVVWED